MARTGGRNSWIACPRDAVRGRRGGARVARAADGPGHGRVGGRHAARRARRPSAAPVAGRPAGAPIAPGDIDCRALYPDEPVDRAHLDAGRAPLADAAPPATAVTSLTDALAPSCGSRARGGRRRRRDRVDARRRGRRCAAHRRGRAARPGLRLHDATRRCAARAPPATSSRSTRPRTGCGSRASRRSGIPEDYGARGSAAATAVLGLSARATRRCSPTIAAV